MSCRCLVQCANFAPQNRQDEHRTMQSGTGEGEGRRRDKRRRGQGKGGPLRARTEELGKKGKKTKTQTPRDDGMSLSYRHNREPARKRGGGMRTQRATQQTGKGRAEMRPGTSQPRKTYVSGRSTETGCTRTRAHTSTAESRRTGVGKGGGVT